MMDFKKSVLDYWWVVFTDGSGWKELKIIECSFTIGLILKSRDNTVYIIPEKEIKLMMRLEKDETK